MFWGYNMEEWKDVTGFDNYQVSNCGRLRNKTTLHILKLTLNRRGYQRTTLQQNGKKCQVVVHRLVAKEFKPNENADNLTVNHIDGNKLNNHIDNLEWLTNKENLKHADDAGLRNIKGEKHHEAKLTEDDVLNIRNSNESITVLAEYYNMTYQAIYKVRKRLSWKHI